MNTQEQVQKKDFTEAKVVIGQLKEYITGKIAQKKQATTMQEEALASQPEIQSDHLTEEAELTPFDGIKENVATEVNTAEVNTTSATLENATIANNQVLTENVGSASNYEELPTDIPKDIPVEGAQAITQSSGSEELANTSYSNATSSEASELIGEQKLEETPVLEETPATLNGQAVGEVPQGEYIQSNIGGETFQNQGDQGTIDGTNLASTGEELLNASGEVNQGMIAEEATGLESGPAQNYSAVTSEIPGMEAIPEIVTPQPGVGEEPQELYQATNDGAQATIADVTPALSDASVIMPEGTTEEIANDQTLVVGPEAFVQSR